MTKKYTNKWMMRAAALMLVVMGSVQSALATTKIYPSNLNIAYGETKQVAINLDTDETGIFWVEMNVILPYGLSPVAGSENRMSITTDEERCPGFDAESNRNTGKIIFSNLLMNPMNAGSGAIFYIDVNLSSSIAERYYNSYEYYIRISNVKIRRADKTYVNDVTVGNGRVTSVNAALSAPEQTIINGGKTASVDVNLDNNNRYDFSIQGFQADVEAPEGWTVAAESDNMSDIQVQNGRILWSSAEAFTAPRGGKLLSLSLTAPEDFKSEATFKLTNVKLTVNWVSVPLDDITFTAKSNDEAKEAIDAIIEDLQKKLDEAKQNIEENDPDVAADYADELEALQSQVDNLKANVESQYETQELDVEAVQAQADAIAADVQAVVDDAAEAQTVAAQATPEGIQAIYDAAAQAIADAKAAIDEQFGDYTSSAAYNNKFAQLEKELADAQAALANVDFTDRAAALQALADAQSFAEKQDAKLDDILSTAAYKAQNGRLAELEEQANAITYNEVLYTLGDVKDIQAQQQAIQDAIDAATQQIAANLASNETSPWKENDNVQELLDAIAKQISDLEVFLVVNRLAPEGDANLDGNVNGLDIQTVISAITAGTYNVDVDVNHDGAINGLDIQYIVSKIVGE